MRILNIICYGMFLFREYPTFIKNCQNSIFGKWNKLLNILWHFSFVLLVRSRPGMLAA